MFAPAYMGRKRCFRMLYSVPELFSLEPLRLRTRQKRSKGLRPAGPRRSRNRPLDAIALLHFRLITDTLTDPGSNSAVFPT
jgi:hypothetical protein